VPNEITGANAGEPRQMPHWTCLAARIAQFWRCMATRVFIAWLMGIAAYALAVTVSPFRDTVSGAVHIVQGALLSIIAVSVAALTTFASSRVKIPKLQFPPRVLLVFLGIALIVVSRGQGFAVGEGATRDLHFGIGTLAGFVFSVLAVFIRRLDTHDDKAHTGTA
jgi:hypothetical protein